MNTILALRGRGNVGKSTTIRMLRALLTANGFKEIHEPINPDIWDFWTIFTKNEKKIGITSSGDTYDLVHDKLTELVNHSCEICVCACRSRGGTNDAIKEFINYSYQFIEKSIDETQDILVQRNLNQQDAQRLLDEINKLI